MTEPEKCPTCKPCPTCKGTPTDPLWCKCMTPDCYTDPVEAPTPAEGEEPPDEMERRTR